VWGWGWGGEGGLSRHLQGLAGGGGGEKSRVQHAPSLNITSQLHTCIHSTLDIPKTLLTLHQMTLYSPTPKT
jgi:hypothetical protein